MPLDLPLAEPDPQLTERADAARNRRRILAAAAALVEERGIDSVSMQDVARAASVGTGTLYRRFGDRAGLALALLDEHTRAFQDALIAGPPPLGPGAPAAERLHAFGARYLELLERHADILLVASPTRGQADPPQELLATHLVVLLREAAPPVDHEFAARSLLASLSPGQFLYLRRHLAWPVERIRRGWCELVDGLLCRSSASG